MDLVAEHGQDRRREVVRAKDPLSLMVDRLALPIDDVVVLDDVLAGIEVVALDARLGTLDGAAHHPGLQRRIVIETEATHDAAHPVAGEATHQVILEGEVEAAAPGIALPAGPTPQLVVDAPRLVALRSHDVQAARSDHLLAVLLAVAFRLLERNPVLLRRRIDDAGPLLVQDLGGHHLRVAAEQDVRPAAGHVGRDGDRTGSARLRHDLRLALVELGVEHVVLDAAPLEHLRQHLADLDADRPHKHRPAQFVLGDDLVHDRVPFAALRTEDEVGEVVPDHLAVGRNDHHLEPVDLAELLPLGLGGPGHARKLVIHAEVVLERDRREGL